jgi:hypothetical protein
MTRVQKASKLLDNLGFVLLFGKVSDAELVKIVLWIKDQLKE